MSWQFKRQLLFLGLFALFLLAIAGSLYYASRPAPSCFDKIKNQDETGVDCGGSQCAVCLDENPKDLIVLWTRFFEVRPGVYDVAALVENPNVLSGVKSLPYQFKLMDADNSTIVSRKANAYVLADERFLIFEPGLVVGGVQKPKRVTFDIKDFEWVPSRHQDPPLRIVHTERMFEGDRPRFTLTLKNETIFDVKGIDVSAVVSDTEGNAVAVAASRVDKVADSAEEEVVFTWPFPFPQNRTVMQVEPFVRRNPW